MQRKIGLIHYTAPPVIGGVESVLFEQAELLLGKGHNVEILCGKGEQWNPLIKVHTIPLLDSRNEEILAVKEQLDNGKVPEVFFSLARKIKALLEPHFSSFNTIFAHNVCSLHKNLPLTHAIHSIINAGSRCQLVNWHHDPAVGADRYKKELHEGFPWSLLSTHLNNTIEVTISADRRRTLASILKFEEELIRIIPNGIDLRSVLKLEDKTIRLAENHGLFHSYPLFLLPARITRRKNIECAIRVIDIVRSSFPDTRLIVTGPPGPHNPSNLKYVEQLLNLRASLHLEENIILPGLSDDSLLSINMIYDLFRLSDALLFPSKDEGFGIPLLEAAMVRLPIFCSSIPPFEEIGGSEVRFFSPEDPPETIAEMILSSLETNPHACFFRRVKERYSWDEIYERYISPLLEQPA